MRAKMVYSRGVIRHMDRVHGRKTADIHRLQIQRERSLGKQGKKYIRR